MSLPDQIVLVGLPGAGKSTVGPLLAQRLGWSFADLDAAIETFAGTTVAEIFAQRGEEEFRRLERELTARLASGQAIVLSVGGGWMMHNRLENALTVWLRVDPETAVDRMGPAAKTRPLLQPEPISRMKQLLAQREQYYELADLVIDTNGRTAEQVAEAVAVAAEKYGH